MNHRSSSSFSISAPRRVKRVVMGVVVALAASAGVAAWAHGHGPARGPGGQGAPIAGLLAANPDHIARGVDRILRGVDATDAQRAQVTKIVQAAAVDLKAQREAGKALRDKSAALFIAPTVDAAAVESLRKQMIAQHDKTSLRVSQALIEVSRVLTPEQRVKLAERLKHHRGHGGWDRGHRGDDRGHGRHGDGPRGDGPPKGPRGDGPPPAASGPVAPPAR